MFVACTTKSKIVNFVPCDLMKMGGLVKMTCDIKSCGKLRLTEVKAMASRMGWTFVISYQGLLSLQQQNLVHGSTYLIRGIIDDEYLSRGIVEHGYLSQGIIEHEYLRQGIIDHEYLIKGMIDSICFIQEVLENICLKSKIQDSTCLKAGTLEGTIRS